MPNQCKKCPWRVDVNPHDIPNGYCEVRHRNLADTIADPGAISFGSAVPMMACHESPIGEERPCVGWMANQLGPGNNIPLRLWASKNLKERMILVGKQHACFEDTLPSDDRT